MASQGCDKPGRPRALQIRLDEFGTRMDVDLTQNRIAGVNKTMRSVRRNNDNASSTNPALYVADRDGGAAFERECYFDVGMQM